MILGLSRWKNRQANQEIMDFMLDFNTIQIGYKGNGQDAEVWKNFVQPYLEKQAKSYKIEKASVYGVAKYGETWKGLRIVKE